MLGLAFHYDPHPLRRELWSYVAAWYGIEDLWEVGQPEDVLRLTRFLPTPINSFNDLPDYPLVVLQPRDGKYVQGSIDIDDYQHPEDAIYCFGYDHGNMDPWTRSADFLYISTERYELYSTFAAVITLERRRAQWGQ